MSVFRAHDITTKNAPPETPATSAIPSKNSATSFQKVKSAYPSPTAPSGAMTAAATPVLSEPSAPSPRSPPRISKIAQRRAHDRTRTHQRNRQARCTNQTPRITGESYTKSVPSMVRFFREWPLSACVATSPEIYTLAFIQNFNAVAHGRINTYAHGRSAKYSRAIRNAPRPHSPPSFAQFAHAESVQWNYVEPNTLYDISNDPSFNAWAGTNWFSGIVSPNVSVTYHAQVTNTDTGAVVPCGSSVSSGTKLTFAFVPHVYTDIYWFASGWLYDSPYGDWVAGAGKPYANMCSSKADKDYINQYSWSLGTVWLYVSLAVAPPAKTTNISSLFSCTGSSSDQSRVCTATGNGSASNTFDFAATPGQFFARIFFNERCLSTNNPMTYSNGVRYTLTVPTQSISCPFTVTAAGTPGSNPTAPTITTGGSHGRPGLHPLVLLIRPLGPPTQVRH